MRFLLVTLIAFSAIQEKELKTHFEVRVKSFLMGAMDTVEVNPYRITAIRNSWRVENNFPIMVSLGSDETEYLYELITSDEFKGIDSPGTYECIDKIEVLPKLPLINLHVSVEEAGEKDLKSFTFNCLCKEYPATDAPEILCNILGDVRRLEMTYLRH